jgi:hypothetical protein
MARSSDLPFLPFVILRLLVIFHLQHTYRRSASLAQPPRQPHLPSRPGHIRCRVRGRRPRCAASDACGGGLDKHEDNGNKEAKVCQRCCINWVTARLPTAPRVSQPMKPGCRETALHMPNRPEPGGNESTRQRRRERRTIPVHRRFPPCQAR